MTEADELELTYYDTCSVFRPSIITNPNGESEFKDISDECRVYQSVPCALSSPSGGKLQQFPAGAKSETDYVLFVRPEIDIQPNDTVIVNRLGRETLLFAGRAENHISHNRVPLKLKKDRV